MFKVTQLGYCVFGEGETENEALIDAAQWLTDRETGHQGVDVSAVKKMLVDAWNAVDGDLILVETGE